MSYDDLGRLTAKDLPGAEPDVSYGYDLLGRMVSASQAGSGLSFGYDLAGRRTHMAWKDGFRIDYSYLVTGEMKTISEKCSGRAWRDHAGERFKDYEVDAPDPVKPH